MEYFRIRHIQICLKFSIIHSLSFSILTFTTNTRSACKNREKIQLQVGNINTERSLDTIICNKNHDFTRLSSLTNMNTE